MGLTRIDLDRKYIINKQKTPLIKGFFLLDKILKFL